MKQMLNLLKKNPIKVEMLRRTYEISDNRYRMYADISEDNRITLKNIMSKETFVFIHSDPELVKRIGEFMIEAAKLIDKKE